jgi:outer membrane lipoprotein carrier protein
MRAGRFALIAASIFLLNSTSANAHKKNEQVVEIGQGPKFIMSQADSNAADQLKQKLTQLRSFEANFKQVVTSVDNEVLQQAEGEIALKQPNKMYWKLDEPNESILIADGQTLWHVDPFVEQVVALEQKQSIENNPLILLTNAQSDAWKNFKVNQQDNIFTINSTQTGASIVKLILHFKQDQLVELNMEDSQQQLSKLIFSGIKQNQPIDDSRFEFLLPEGYDVDDQRTK